MVDMLHSGGLKLFNACSRRGRLALRAGEAAARPFMRHVVVVRRSIQGDR
jgi:hypothetical protein